MKITIDTTGEASEKMRALMKAKGNAVGGSVEWDIVNPAGGLTMQEIAALQRKHGSRRPNLERASEVKALMAKGHTCKEIKGLLRRKYGARMIEADHATLSRAGEGFGRGKKTALRF